MQHGIPISCGSPTASLMCDPSAVDYQYATNVCDELCDSNYYRHVGYRENNKCIQKYFSTETVNLISRKVTELLQGVDPLGRPILVPANSICSIMSNVYDSFRPETGDIYSRYTIPTKSQQSNVQNMIDQVIEIITSQVRTELGMEENNAKLTAWTTVLGDFNLFGLQSHPPIKTRQRRPMPMMFNLNY